MAGLPISGPPNAERCFTWWIAWTRAARIPEAEPVTQSSRVIDTISMMVRTP
ncbi:hypothetical protein GCM10023107_01920 [Actinoplanes octamycinicus]